MVYRSDYRHLWDALKGRLALKAPEAPSSVLSLDHAATSPTTVIGV